MKQSDHKEQIETHRQGVYATECTLETHISRQSRVDLQKKQIVQNSLQYKVACSDRIEKSKANSPLVANRCLLVVNNDLVRGPLMSFIHHPNLTKQPNG